MKPEQLVEKLRKVQPLSLRSVILYGSAVTGDFVKKRSDFNVLVIVERLGVPELRALSSVARRWVKAGNPPPLLFTLERLKQSADVFPIEILDMKAANRVLYGQDVLSRIPVSEENLRHQVESELKGKLIQLREAYLITGGKPRAVAEVMVRSLASFLVLFRAALRLYRIEAPAKKLDALAALARRIPLDPTPFETVEALKEGHMKVRQVNADALFGDFLKTVETVVDAIDSYVHGRERAEEQELSS